MKKKIKYKKIKLIMSDIALDTVVWEDERKGRIIDIDHNNKRVLVDWVTSGSKFTSWRTIDNLEFK